MAGQKITLYALDCGTVNWRLYRMEYHYEGDNARHVTSPLSSPLAHFSGRRLPAVLLLTPDGIAKQAIGETALGYLEDPKARKRIREFFKPSIGSHVIDDPKPHQLRYSHFDALFFTRLLLRSLIDQIRNSVVHGAGGLQLDRRRPKSISAAINRTDFLVETIFYLQLGRTLDLQYINVYNQENVTTSKRPMFSVT